ncbi:hypothetical protein [Aquisphaera insulae]|uniref:hypothetical protein n=1 Tax=Aquisphaera insulae TaxID=2712864 RepID=UPI0013EB9E9A|nr:hypothetical protein [Aquisphaera insulae]
MSDQADNLRQLVRAHRQWKQPGRPRQAAGTGLPAGCPGGEPRRGSWLARAARRALGLAT